MSRKNKMLGALSINMETELEEENCCRLDGGGYECMCDFSAGTGDPGDDHFISPRLCQHTEGECYCSSGWMFAGETGECGNCVDYCAGGG